MKKGALVWTPFGQGTVLSVPSCDVVGDQLITRNSSNTISNNNAYRNTNNNVPTYTIQLPYGRLFVPNSLQEKYLHDIMSSEELNASYEALEKMRKLNLEVECNELGILCHHEKCVLCLFASASELLDHNNSNSNSNSNENTREATTQAHTGGLLSLGKLFSLAGGRNNKTTTTTKPKKGTPCLICGDPVCSQHSSPSFRKEKLTLCFSCEELFQLQFCGSSDAGDPAEEVQKTFSSEEEMIIKDLPEQDDILLGHNRHKLDQMIDQMTTIYDRCMLLLSYSAQFIPDLAAQLESAEVRNNQFRLGTSTAGFLSGTLGFVSASALLAPVGAPLILASVILAGGSLVAQGGNAAVNHFDQTKGLADKIIAYHGMILSILQAAHSLRVRILAIRSHFHPVLNTTSEQQSMHIQMQMDTQQQDKKNNDTENDSQQQQPNEKNKAGTFLKTMSMVGTAKTSNDVAKFSATGIRAGTRAIDTVGTASSAGAAATVGQAAAEVAETSSLYTAADTATTVGATTTVAESGATATAATKEGSNLLSSITTGMTPVIGTAFSVAMMALAARTATSTLKKIQAGNPCDKAMTLRTIQKNLESLPDTNDLDEECRYLLSIIP